MYQVELIESRKKQHGSALVVALVIVLVSTLLGVSAMQSSTIEAQLANNTKFQQAAFRAAEAAADSLLTMDNIVTLVNEPSSSVTTSSSIESHITVSANFQALGEGPAPGYSLGGRNGFQSLKFVSSATATIDAVDSSSRVIQGAQRLTFSREK